MTEAREVRVGRHLVEALKRVKARWGNHAWQSIGTEFREALLRAEVLAVINQMATLEDTEGGALAHAAMCWEGGG